MKKDAAYWAKEEQIALNEKWVNRYGAISTVSGRTIQDTYDGLNGETAERIVSDHNLLIDLYRTGFSYYGHIQELDAKGE